MLDLKFVELLFGNGEFLATLSQRLRFPAPSPSHALNIFRFVARSASVSPRYLYMFAGLLVRCIGAIVRAGA